MKLKIILLFLFMSLRLADGVQAQLVSDSTQLYPLEKEWTVFDRETEDYVPYFPKIHTTVNKIHIVLDSRKHPGFRFILKGLQGDYLFIDNRLLFTFKKEHQLYMSIDSLAKLYRNQNMLITYYSPRFLEKNPEAYMASSFLFRNKISPFNKVEEWARVKPPYAYRNFLTVVSVIQLILIAIVIRFNTDKKNVFLGIYLPRVSKSGFQAKRLQNITFLIFSIYFGFTFAFTLFFLGTYSHILTYERIVTISASRADLTIDFITIGLFVIFTLLVKYAVIWFLGKLYNDRQITTLHFQEYMQIAQNFCTILALIMVLAHTVVIQYEVTFSDFLVYIFCIFLIIKAVLVSYRLNQVFTYKKVYLFSYLCATEYVPILFSAKLFANF
jgi:Domain of unknown function (DUF4271)